MPPQRSWSSSLLTSPPVVISLLLIFALSFILFTLSNVNKTTWDDSFNVFLILLAIFYGFFFKKNDYLSRTPYHQQQQQHAFTGNSVIAPSDDAYVNLRITEEERYVSHQWFGFSFYELEEGNITYHTPPTQLRSPATGDSRLRRSTSLSFRPDLTRQQPSCGTGTDRYKFRYSDDLEMDLPATDQVPVNHRTRRRGDEKEDNDKEIRVVESEENKSGKSEKKKSNMKKGVATVWASILSNQKKRKKKQRTNSIHNDDSHSALQTSSELPNKTRALPPPSVFHSLFKKGLCKGSKVHSVLAPTPLRLMPPAMNTAKQIPLSPVPPSPLPMEDDDVDVKAATFIAKLKDAWKLEKLKSMKEKANFRPKSRPISIERI